ncbi:MAG: molybdopterin-dependent oxidoreductase [Streptosporangiales bacterium]|nr:molybdopterin-dependent oxidoreductase [Streptosporangiales bacterium]
MREHEDRGTPVGRRVVLGMLGLGAVGVVFGEPASAGISRALAPLTSRDPSGLSGVVPAAGGFRYYSVTGTEPERDARTYRLTVGGLVDKPRTLRYGDLADLPQTGLTKDFQCVTGWRVLGVPWAGVRLSDLLDTVGVRPGAKAVLFTSFDGTYTESLTLAQARRPDILVATMMYGRPVTRSHGGPVRLYVAPMYGYKSLKWLGGIQVSDRVVPGYWEERGYDIDAWVGRSNGRDDEPTG